MENLRQNSNLYWMIIAGMGVCVMCAMNVMEELTEAMELVPLPEEIEANFVMLIIGDFAAAVIYRKILSWLFSGKASSSSPSHKTKTS